MLVYHAENYIDFFTIFINEDYDEYQKLKDNKEDRIDMILEGDEDSPYYLFSLAEINLQWATVRLKFGERFTPAKELYRANNFLEKNMKKFPDFISNKKSLSIIHALGESLPSIIQKVGGIDGSIEKGTKEISELAAYSDTHDYAFRDETYAIYAYILLYQNNDKEEAYRVLFKANLDHSKNPLLCFLKSNIAQRNGYNDEAIQILNERPKSTAYFPFDYLDFMYGKFKLYELDPSSKKYILSFVNNFNGRHFIKEAYQKLAWYEIAIEENIAQYKSYMDKVQEKGFELVDEDKQALKESENKEIPNSILLQARLLFDGGYYTKAYNLLVKKSFLFPISSPYYLEFEYRMGRLCQELKNYTDAIDFYKATIRDGESSSSFMACNAALQMGHIYESQGLKEKAIIAYEKCLDIKPTEYQSSLHQKAKSGLERVKN